MAETIESFVAKLQQEGVEAGQQQAEQIRADAEKQARETVEQAQAEAERIRNDAKKEAEDLLARARTELDLAARDAILRLQEALARALEGVLSRQVGEDLEDVGFLRELLHELVRQFAQSDFECRQTLRIDVKPEVRDQLVSWAMDELAAEAKGEKHHGLDLKGTLGDAGFEYTCDGSTVEVTRESVVETLMDLVGPALREVVRKAADAEAHKE